VNSCFSITLVFLLSLIGSAESFALKSKVLDARSDRLNLAVVIDGNPQEKSKKKELIEKYFKRALKKEVQIKGVSSYAEVSEALRTGEADIGRSAPAAYAKLWLANRGKVKPIAGELDKNGRFGYHVVVVVRADSRYQGLGHLGKSSVAFTNRKSKSGFQAPRYFLKQAGADVRTFFGKIHFSGSHEQSILDLMKGKVKSAVTWWRSDRDSIMHRMVLEGKIDPKSWRIVWKSPLIPSTPWVASRDRMRLKKGDLEKAFSKALFSMPDKDPRAWGALTSGRASGLKKVNHLDYQHIVQMLKN
jgi:phosphonate transport system substrate-binding protein